MPVTIRLLGERHCPGFDCDHCGRPIRDAADGNYHWDMAESDTPTGTALSFTHKRCCTAFERARPGPDWGCEELAVLPVLLSRNVRLDRRRAEAIAEVADGWGLPAF